MRLWIVGQKSILCLLLRRELMDKLSPGSGDKPLGRADSRIPGSTGNFRYWARLVLRSLQDAFAPESQLVASSIGFYTLFSLFPLALLVIAIAGIWLDPILAETRILEELEFVAPGISALLGENLENLARSRGPVTGVAAITLIWSASSVFNVLTRIMDRMWGIDINHRRSVWRHRTVGVIMTLSITIILLIASTLEGTFFSILNSLMPDALSGIGPVSTRFWATFVNILLFAILYYFIPHVKLGWRDVLPGALLAGVLWQVAKQLFLYFIANYLSRSNLIYGSVGAIIAFLTWTYLSSLILLSGAYLNRHAARRREAPAG